MWKQNFGVNSCFRKLTLETLKQKLFGNCASQTNVGELRQNSPKDCFCLSPRKELKGTHYVEVFEDIHNSWLYCFINPLELGSRGPVEFGRGDACQ